jgi:hypothetical protein
MASATFYGPRAVTILTLLLAINPTSIDLACPVTFRTLCSSFPVAITAFWHFRLRFDEVEMNEILFRTLSAVPLWRGSFIC